MYPTLAEYTDALKVDLGLALSDPLLTPGTLVRHHPGLPVTRGGTFAATFAVEVEGRKYALRCFLREIESLQARYAAIGHLHAGNRHYSNPRNLMPLILPAARSVDVTALPKSC